MKNKQANIDTETLQLLPVPIILFDSNKIYFLNKKAIDLFEINEAKLNEIALLNPYSFITEPHKKKVKKIHAQIFKGNRQSANGIHAALPAVEAQHRCLVGRT